MNPTRPLAAKCVVVGRGAGLEPKTIAPGTTGQVLTTVTTGAEPVFAAPATVNLTTGVTGVLPVANGGTGQTVGAVAIMQFVGTAVAAGITTFLGRTNGAAATVWFPSPVIGTVIELDVVSSVAPGGTDTFNYQLQLAGATGHGTLVNTGATNKGSFVPTTAGVVKGDTIAIRLATSATAAVTDHMVTLAIRVDG